MWMYLTCSKTGTNIAIIEYCSCLDRLLFAHHAFSFRNIVETLSLARETALDKRFTDTHCRIASVVKEVLHRNFPGQVRKHHHAKIGAIF